MALRRITKIGEAVLRKKAKPVEKVDDKIVQLIEDMADTMYDAEGVGLAAPQVGILKRVIVVDIGSGLIELVNPEIIESDGEQVDAEACLSIKDRSGNVRRPYYIKVRGLNKNGQQMEFEAEEFLARALCHEIDHLDGILFVDKIEN